MRSWKPTFDLGRDDGPPFLRIARAIEREVRRGRLRPGDPLPGTRTLAEELGVHRNTVAAAYAELTAQGWLTAARGRGSFVSGEIPDEATPDRGASVASPEPLFLRANANARPALWPAPREGVLALSGVADARLLPLDELARAYRRAARALRDTAGHYTLSGGHPRLVAALKDMLATRRGIPRDRDLFVTRGSQMALFLLIEVLFSPGDAVAVEDPGYEFSWDAFRRRKVDLVPVPVDGEGLRVDVLARILERRELRAVMTTPGNQYPTTVTLSARRREALLRLAAKHRFAILEDDVMHEYRFDGPTVLPLASKDREGTVLYVGSLSKVWLPSIRLGYVVGPKRVLDEVASVRRLVDVCGDPVLELAMAELIEDGELQRHVLRARRALAARRDALAAALREELGTAVSFRKPSSGTTIWVEVDPSIDVNAWSEKAKARGVLFLDGGRFHMGEPVRPALLLGFASLHEKELAEAVRRMALALDDVGRGRRR